jgi:signal transduction histidine kinase
MQHTRAWFRMRGMLMTVLVVETLGNVTACAHASHARTRRRRENGRARVGVRAESVGRVNPDSGADLRGLADRVSALDGQLTIGSTRRGGTTIVWEIPCWV